MALRQLRTQSSILLTLRVLQFVKQLRRRLEPRPQASGCSSPLGAETCLDLESQALKSLAKGMSRTSLQNRKHLLNASGRVCKSKGRSNIRPKLKPKTIQNIAGGEVQHIIDTVDEKLSPPGSVLSAVASDNKLFLKQDAGLHLEACTLNDIIQSLVAVHEAITVLEACRSQYGDNWLIAQGEDAGLNFDELFIANYEHLLWRLRTQLIEALARKVLESLLLGARDKKQQRLLAWFTEFSDKPRPLSTFPWTIKPSLAVLWGVCWMFYNPSDQNNAQRSNLRVSQSALLQSVELPEWGAPGSADYINFGLELLGTQTTPAAPQQPRDAVDLRLRNAEAFFPADLSGQRQAFSRVSPQSASGPGSGKSNQRARGRKSHPLAACPGLTTIHPIPSYMGLTTYCPLFPTALHADNPDINTLLPPSSGNATLIAFPQTFDVGDYDQPWHQLPQTSLPQRPARHLTTSIPSVRVTGSADNEGFAAPQTDFVAFNNPNIYPPSAQEPQAPPLNLLTDFSEFVNPSYNNMGNCQPPEVSPTLALQAPRHERTSSVNSNTNMPTPVSMAGPRSPLLSPAHDRRPSTASSMGPLRQQSEDISSQDGDDASSPRRNHAYKRAEEPPKNADGKMICKHQDCASLTFDRKCDKHMDKHDRPYKCNVKGCEKLQGFTYSGGLLRHEREVHKMHGGTKKSLYCPFADCKRSSGSGFTRKENLAEHIRRVHRRTSMSADMGHLIISRRESMDENSIAEVRLPSESPFQRIIEEHAEEEQFSLKRKRSDAGLPEEREDNDLRSEVKRLRRENEEKDARLRQLEAAVMALQQGRR
ncbi:hypothetical protein K458DRAFT_309074 [Lentithecium fluviatile CBS 122367]|uniref:C2H2-type domain-containing protein n=1 Tax=Lentithecium fluviatile CBS 122367 TaxID=1168545 RepID=A0A6G1IUJ1_9PLEO|nr:hypothetical protein K458DRAFT_309074 [Lentithecium fluviatile CBS 122367]